MPSEASTNAEANASAAASGSSEPESQPASAAAPPPPDRGPAVPPRLGLDRQGLLEALGGSVIALIALFSSYDHITLPGRVLQLQQQWGIWLIAASLALVFADAELATRSRSREKARLDRDEYRFHREEHRFLRAENLSSDTEN